MMNVEGEAAADCFTFFFAGAGASASGGFTSGEGGGACCWGESFSMKTSGWGFSLARENLKGLFGLGYRHKWSKLASVQDGCERAVLLNASGVT